MLLRRGDVAVIAAAQRPHQGAQGAYTEHLRHGIGRVWGARGVGVVAAGIEKLIGSFGFKVNDFKLFNLINNFIECNSMENFMLSRSNLLKTFNQVREAIEL